MIRKIHVPFKREGEDEELDKDQSKERFDICFEDYIILLLFLLAHCRRMPGESGAKYKWIDGRRMYRKWW